jgi:ribokinase
MGGRVLVVGGINADLVIETSRRPGPGETVLGSAYVLGYGGKGANQAVAAAVAGVAVAMVGAVGADEWGRAQLAELVRFGVDVSTVQILAGTPTGLAAIAVTPDGENSILVAPGANHAISAEGLAQSLTAAWAGGGRDGDVVVAQCELAPAVIEEAARFARSIGARLTVNAAPVIDVSAATLAAADPLVVNEHEARDVLRGRGTGVGTATAVAAGVRLARDVLRVTGARSVVVTLGADGAAIATAAGSRQVAGEKVEVVDTTGAGDTFVGTLAARLSLGDELEQAVREACAAAARCVTWFGTRPPKTTGT